MAAAAAAGAGGGLQSEFENAVRQRDWNEVARLLDMGADPNVYIELDQKGSITTKVSPVWFALISKGKVSEDVVLKMLDKGLDPNTRLTTDANSITIITRAIKDKHKRLIKSLIDRGANVTVRDAQKKTLLQLAIETGNAEIRNMIRGGLPAAVEMENIAPLGTAYVALGHGRFLRDATKSFVPPGTKVVLNQQCGLLTRGLPGKFFKGENPEYLNPEMHVDLLRKRFGDLVIVNEGDPLPDHELILFSYWRPGAWLPDKYGFSTSGIYTYPFMKEQFRKEQAYNPNTLLDVVSIPLLFEHSIYPKKEDIEKLIQRFNEDFKTYLVTTVSAFNTNRAKQLLEQINTSLEKNALDEDIKVLATGWRDWLQGRLEKPDEPIGVLEQEINVMQQIVLLPLPGSQGINLFDIMQRLKGYPTIDEFFKLPFGFALFNLITVIKLSDFMKKIKDGEFTPGVFYMPLCRYVSKELQNAIEAELSGNDELRLELHKPNNNQTRRQAKNLFKQTIGETEFYRKAGIARNVQKRFAQQIADAEEERRLQRRPEDFLNIRKQIRRNFSQSLFTNPDEAKKKFQELINMYEGLSYEEATRYIFDILNNTSKTAIYKELIAIFFRAKPLLTPPILQELLEKAVKQRNIILAEELLKRGAVALKWTQLLLLLDNIHDQYIFRDLMNKYSQVGGKRRKTVRGRVVHRRKSRRNK